MSNTNTSTNNGQNWNQNSRRGWRGQGGPTGRGRGDHRNGCRNTIIAKYAFEGKMKDSPISKLLITESGYRPTQFKKITDNLPVLCTDKKCWGLNEILWTGANLDEGDFMPPYPNANQWSTTHHVQISTVKLMNVPLANGLRPAWMEWTQVLDANLPEEQLLEYKRNSKNKSQEYAKFLTDKKALITTIFGQCDEATKTKILYSGPPSRKSHWVHQTTTRSLFWWLIFGKWEKKKYMGKKK